MPATRNICRERTKPNKCRGARPFFHRTLECVLQTTLAIRRAYKRVKIVEPPYLFFEIAARLTMNSADKLTVAREHSSVALRFPTRLRAREQRQFRANVSRLKSAAHIVRCHPLRTKCACILCTLFSYFSCCRLPLCVVYRFITTIADNASESKKQTWKSAPFRRYRRYIWGKHTCLKSWPD